MFFPGSRRLSSCRLPAAKENFMKTTLLGALLIPAVLPVCLTADSEQPGCSLKDFRGTYAFTSSGTNVINDKPILFAGILVADGKGRISAWKDWVSLAADPPLAPALKIVPPLRDILQQAQSLGNEITYSVEPDCRISITTAVPGPAPGIIIPVNHIGALASGGDEVLLINGASGSPYLTMTTMKRALKASENEDLK